MLSICRGYKASRLLVLQASTLDVALGHENLRVVNN